MAVPWTLLGYAGPPNPHLFGDYGSYPSGPAQDPKDAVANGDGIACQPDGICYVSTPTAVAMSLPSATSQANRLVTVFLGAGLLSVATALFLGRRRIQVSRKRNLHPTRSV